MEILMTLVALNMAIVPLKLLYDAIPINDTVSTSHRLVPFYVYGALVGYIQLER